jgi:hypothetical protein
VEELVAEEAQVFSPWEDKNRIRCVEDELAFVDWVEFRRIVNGSVCGADKIV